MCREMGDITEEIPSLVERLGRAVYVHVDLDSVVHNLRLMQECCKNRNIGMMCVVKANAYGHGAVPVARHLKNNSVERLAVATVAEGIQLRQGDITGPIHVLGNVQSWEMASCVQHHLVPTVSTTSAIEGMADVLRLRPEGLTNISVNTNDHNYYRSYLPVGTVHIKVDTGMSRNGCQPHQLPELVQLCKDYDVPVEGIFSHIADHDDTVFTNQQLHTFQECIEPFRNQGFVFHMSGSGAIILGHGTELDFIRPGISLYGVSGAVENLESFIAKGFRPSLSVKGVPTLVKKCKVGSKVGYGCTYTCQEDQWVATFPVGYADGIWRCLSGKGCVVRDKTGEKCPYVGRVSMDALTVRLPCQPDPHETFTIVTADFDPITSTTGIARIVDTIPNEVLTRLSTRLPRVYYTAKSGYETKLEALEIKTGTASVRENTTPSGGRESEGSTEII